MTASDLFGDFFSIENKSIKTYATEAALVKALEKVGCTRMDRPLLVCTKAGRYTAIIPAAACDGNMTAFPGFMKLG